MGTIGAALAVSLGAGGFFVAQAASGPSESTIVTVTPERTLDTREPNNIGPDDPFTSATAQKLQVTGPIPTATGTKTVVPTGATGVLLNVTPVNPTAAGFISIRPGDATGTATTSSLNFTTGIEGIVPNAVQVAMPTTGTSAGRIDITYDAYGQSGPTTDILIDVVGHMTNTGLQELVADVEALEAQIGAGYVKQSNALILFTAPTEQVLVDVDLPAGNHLVTAKVNANNHAPTGISVRCRLRLGGVTIDDSFDVRLQPDAVGDRAIIALTSGGVLAAPGTASLVCVSGTWLSPSITAMQVVSLTGSASSLDTAPPSGSGE